MGVGVGAAQPSAAGVRHTVVVVQRAVDLDEVYEQRRCRKQTRPWCHAHSEAGATADEGPAERCHCWGRKHRQRESVEGGEREGERSQLEQLQVAGEREVCEAGEEQSVRPGKAA